MKKYIKEIIALVFGLICGLITFVQYSGSAKECDPIIVSMNCSAVKGGIQMSWTSDAAEDFNDDQSVSTGEITGEQNIELQLNAKKLHKLKMDLGNNPGVVTLKDIKITAGDSTVKITNFDNTIRNDVEEFFWNGDNIVFVRSFKADPYIIFQTPFNLEAKVNPAKSYKGALVNFLLGTLLFYLVLFIASRIAKKNDTDLKQVATGLLKNASDKGLDFIKKYIKEVIALAIGLSCGCYLFHQNTDSGEELDPIVISLNCNTVVGGIQLYYTTEENQDFSNSQVVGANEVVGDDNHLEFLLGVKSLHKLRLDLGSVPGVVTLRDITISGDKTVKITNFDNTITNDIDEVFWEGNKVFVKSLKTDPYIIFQNPFNVNAKTNYTHSYIQSLIALFIAALIAYLVICLIVRIIKKDSSDFKIVYTVSMFMLAGVLASLSAKILSEKVGSYYQKEISVSAKIKAENPNNFTFFYTASPEEPYGPQHVTDVPLTAGENEFTVTLPIKHLEKLRIDFGIKPGVVEVESLTIHGKEDIEIKGDEFNSSVVNELEEFKVINGKLHIKSTTDDPWLAFNRDFRLGGPTIVSINFVIFITLFLTILAFLTFGVKVTSKHVEGKRVEDLALIIVFIAVCIAPSFFLTDKKVSESEKRNLAEFPAISDSTGFNSAFSTQFDSWYSDHFAKRDEIVSINNTIFQSDGSAQNSSVIEGEDGWFFYKLDKNIDNYANLHAISDEDLVLIKNYLLTINNWCNAHGKKLYFLICPNKATIYGEKVKHIKKFESDENSDAMRVMNFLKGSEIKAVFSKDEIMKHKNDGYLLYRKQDTHHSDIGAYYSYKAIMDVISKDFPIAATPLSSIPMWDYKDVQNCDLKSMMPGAIKNDTSTYKHLDLSGGQTTNGGTAFQFTASDPKAAYRLYMLGDSFSIALQYLFTSNFQFINANRANQYWFPNEELDKIEANSDIVIFEVVERHLSLLAHQTVDSKMQPFAPQPAK